MGIQSRLGKETTGAPPAKGRSAANVAKLLTVAGDASAGQTANVTKDLLAKTMVGRQDGDDSAATSDGD